jgi:ABC-type Fe3+-hydroxamate transport system substrate-binding protein
MSAPEKYQQTWADAGGVAHDGRDAHRHQRIVSLVPSLTETLCAVGAKEKLAGCTAFCIKPGGLLKDPAITLVGGTKTVKRERLLALRPDLLLLNLEENTLEDIDYFKSRVECYVNGVKTVAQGIETLREVGALAGSLELGDSLARKAEDVLIQVTQRVVERTASGGRPPGVFYPIWREPWMTINGDTFIDSHIKTCGGTNVFAHLSARYPAVSPDEIRAAEPEIVWLPSEPYIFKQKHVEEIQNLLGGAESQNRRVELVDGDNICWFGARQAEGLAYTFRQLWKMDLDAGPLPLEVPDKS